MRDTRWMSGSGTVEVVGYRRGHIFRVEVDDVELGITMICNATDDGSWAGVGVFIDGEPVAVEHYGVDEKPHAPTAEQAEKMRRDYAQATPREWF